MNKRRWVSSLAAGLLGLSLTSCLSDEEILQVLLMAAGGSHTCAGLEDGTVKCWGQNTFGQLGLGDTDDRGDNAGEMGNDLPVTLLGTGRVAIALLSNLTHTCALLDNGTVKCWGDNFFGQLGQGDTVNRGDGLGEMGNSLPVINLGTGRTALAITAGQDHTCALLDNDTVKCWGRNDLGQLGQGDTTSRGDDPAEMGDSLPAIALGTGRTASAIAAGDFHACALLDDGTVKCWGYNGFGQLGQEDTTDRGDGPGEMGDNLLAIGLGGGLTADAIAAGRRHTCALLGNDTLKCWGSNTAGKLGQGDTTDRGDDPGEMGNNLPAIALGTGRTPVAVATRWDHVCALLNDATVKCWGENGSGQLGLGNTNARGDDPGEMGNNLPAVSLGTALVALAITVGQNHSCALFSDGRMKCWGENSFGQLGQGDAGDRGDGFGEMGDNLLPINVGTF